MEKKLTLTASIDNFDRVNEFIRSCTSASGCSMVCKHTLLLVTEEIFVNIVNYAYEPSKSGSIEIIFDSTGDDIVTLQFIDKGKAFDPLKIPPPDITAPVEARTPGGLGIFMTRKLMDSVQYERCNENNILTVSKSKQ